MGMAASQARLLCITARLHDVEYQAQAIQGAKVQLATQSDQVYQEYLDAMDATTLTVNSMNLYTGASSVIAANFNNLCSRNRVTPADGSTYAIRNNQGLLLVEDDIEEGYYEFTSSGLDDPYQFAMYMIGGPYVGSLDGGNKDFATIIEEAEDHVFNNLDASEKSANTTLGQLYSKLVQLVGNDIYDTNTLMSSGDDKKIQEYEETLAKFRRELYKNHADEIYARSVYNYMNSGGSTPPPTPEPEPEPDSLLIDPDPTPLDSKKVPTIAGSIDISDRWNTTPDTNTTIGPPSIEQKYDPSENFETPLFNYFVNIYNQIKACGGCVSINEYDGPDGDAANNTEWLQSMIQSGQFSIETVETDKSTGYVNLDPTSPSSDTCLAYTPTSTIDNRALAKAEAEYEHKMKKIDQKDKRFDLDLSKLETERTALTTEYESAKKVIEENIDRTFGIFS